MKKTPLERRVKAFEQLGSKFQRVSLLTAGARIPTSLWIDLQQAARLYIGPHWWEDPSFRKALNITPNGMIVPKRDKVLEYNLLVRQFAKIINYFELDPLIESWHVPLNVRIKYGQADAGNMTRDHPTEHPHSDSWAGESAESVTVHIPLFGDTERNYVQMFYPPDDFEEGWLGPRATYLEGARDIAPRYRKIDHVTTLGSMMLMDFATLHASTHLPGAGPRLSIDTTFVLRKPGSDAEVMHPWRKEERVSHEVLSGVGETHLLYFPDSPDQQVDSQGGFKHPTNLVLRRIDGTQEQAHVKGNMLAWEEP